MRETKRRERGRGKKSRRKSESRRLKKTRIMRKKTPQKGGLIYKYNFGNNVLVIHPSIIRKEDDSITKIYYKPQFFNNEKEKYDIFDSIDRKCKYHSKIYSYGQIILDDHLSSDDQLKVLKTELINDPKGTYLNDQRTYKIKMEESMYYMDMEYGGKTILDVPVDRELQKKLLEFFIGVLQVNSEEGLYLVHGDPHTGNISCNKDIDGDYIIKYIDISQITLIPSNHIIKRDDKTLSLKENDNNYKIRSQFSSMIGTIRTIFGYQSEIASELSAIERIDREYETVLNEVIDVLQSHLAHINEEGSPSSDRQAQGDYDSPGAYESPPSYKIPQSYESPPSYKSPTAYKSPPSLLHKQTKKRKPEYI